MKKISLILRSNKFVLSSPYLKQFSIIKNKDQKGELDKSYSGTDSRHLSGSNRVLDDDEKSIITKVVTDKAIHNHLDTSGSSFGKENLSQIGKVANSFGTTDQENKAELGQYEKNSKKEEIKNKENPNLEIPSKQEKF